MEKNEKRYWIRDWENLPRVTFRFNSNFESYRIHTFKNFPNKNIDYEYLANLGFYYTGEGEDDEVVCFSCGRKCQGFTNFDSTFIVEHEDFCERLRDNIPLRRNYGANQYHYHSPEIKSPGTDAGIHNQSERRETDSCKGKRDQNSLFPCGNPIVPEMKDIIDRMKTFVKGWNGDTDGPTLTMAKCGFYYTGEKDTLKCYYCAGKILNWKEDVDFFVLHAKHYPNCEYILKMIGPELVTSIVKEYPKAIRPIVRNPCKSFQIKNIDLLKPIKEEVKIRFNQERKIEENIKTRNDKHCKTIKTNSFQLQGEPIFSYENSDGFVNYCFEKNEITN